MAKMLHPDTTLNSPTSRPFITLRTKLKTSPGSMSKTSKQQHVSVGVKTKRKQPKLSCVSLGFDSSVQQTGQSVSVTLLTRQTLPLPGLQQDGPLSVQVSWLAALTQVGLGNVLPVDAHAVYVLPGTRQGTTRPTFNAHTDKRLEKGQ